MDRLRQVFRTDDCSTTSSRGGATLKDTLEFEFFVLDNADIIDYLLNKSDVLGTVEKLVLDKINAKLLASNDASLADVLDSREKKELVSTIILGCSNALGIPAEKPLKCLWLTDYDSVVTLYANNDTCVIDEYNTDGCLCISDLGEDGKLFVNTQIPLVKSHVYTRK